MSRVADRFTAGFDAEVVRAWITDDPDPDTRAELQKLLDAATIGTRSPDAAHSALDPTQAARAELEDRFAGPLVFGTAGLRGEIAAGPNRMNRAVVIRAAAGLARFLTDTVGAGFRVVIGCDARFKSSEFARDTAAVIAAAGGRAIQLPDQLPTPLLAFALRHLGADAGVMVTASHNPPADNGYKVYLGERPLLGIPALRATAATTDASASIDSSDDPADPTAAARAGAGAQIVTPADSLIAERITAIDSVASIPRIESSAPAPAAAPTTDAQPAADSSSATETDSAAWNRLDGSIVEAYLARIEQLGVRAESDLRIVHTSMHGVGAGVAEAALARAGFTSVHPVTSQQAPDPRFPTVAFPNPEEAGALDESYALAREVGAELIIANDPDADRFSAAIPDATTDSGYRQLTGDEVGLLLGEDIAGRLATGSASTAPVFANSIVSSRGLAAAVRSHGFSAVNTLTGFKWISRVPDLVFGYEEALGYCVDPSAVRDKDGISAAVIFASLTSRLKAAGRSLDDELARIRARDGHFATAPLSFRLADVSLIAVAMSGLRKNPPDNLGGSPVTKVHDLAEGDAGLPATDGMVLFTQDDSRVIVRPSGTEPKLKCYLEAVAPAAVAQEPGTAHDLRSKLATISSELRDFFAL